MSAIWDKDDNDKKIVTIGAVINPAKHRVEHVDTVIKFILVASTNRYAGINKQQVLEFIDTMKAMGMIADEPHLHFTDAGMRLFKRLENKYAGFEIYKDAF